MERTLNLVKEDLAKNNISLVKNYQQNLPSLLINENEMMEVFLNIILNAIEAMPDGGKLQIDINKFYDPQREDNFVQIGITDQGVGIPAENLDRIFDRYFTTKPNGTGLGLAIVDRVIQAHNGFVEVKSEEGRGTSFLINLPSHNL
jgi:signal transduction histidine kinase